MQNGDEPYYASNKTSHNGLERFGHRRSSEVGGNCGSQTESDVCSDEIEEFEQRDEHL